VLSSQLSPRLSSGVVNLGCHLALSSELSSRLSSGVVNLGCHLALSSEMTHLTINIANFITTSHIREIIVILGMSAFYTQ
jgi:hypothetical protein